MTSEWNGMWNSQEILVCDDYISFCRPIVWFVYIYTYIYILHYTNDNILRTNIADTWIINLN